MILTDDVIAAEKPCLQQMMEAYAETGGNMVAAMEVPPEKASAYGVLDVAEDMGAMVRARGMVESLFGREPAGLWPSEGGVSEAVARIAAETGFRWLASDEGVLGRTLEISFSRDARGVPDNAVQLYSPYRLPRDGLMQEIERIAAMGVKITCNHRVTDVAAENAAGGVDAVFVGVRAGDGNHGGVPGGRLAGGRGRRPAGQTPAHAGVRCGPAADRRRVQPMVRHHPGCAGHPPVRCG